MKNNKITSALIALGIISLAGAAQAQTVIYLTGSTAFRAVVYSALTTPGEVFTAAPTIHDPAAAGSSASYIAFEGNVTGIGDTLVNCSWTGSEAGIASVAGQTLGQTLAADPNSPGTTWPLPGSPASFLVSPYNSTASLAVNTHADIAMADTSQAVSRTPEALYPLTPMGPAGGGGVVGVIPFTWVKCYDSSPDQAWINLTNVPVNAAYVSLEAGDAFNASNFTGNNADTSDGVAQVGRNFGSGTRANELLTSVLYPILAPITQYAFGTGNTLYPSSAQGTLTFGVNADGTAASAPYASGQNLYQVDNDGFDSGGSVAKTLEVDWKNQGVIGIGLLGLPDAKNATTGHDHAGNDAVYIAYNGVYEGDQAIINGNYPCWGAEHCYGQVSPSAAATTFGNTLVAGIKTDMVNIQHAGTATGNVLTAAQSNVLPTSVMLVTRNGSDNGFPVQCAAGGF